MWTGISKIASLQSFHTRAVFTQQLCSRHLDALVHGRNCMLCVCPVWDVVFLRFAAVEQINSGCCLQRCDQGYRQPTFCFTRAHFQQPDSRLLTKSAPSTGRHFSQMCSSAAKCGTQRWTSKRLHLQASRTENKRTSGVAAAIYSQFSTMKL